MNSAFVEWAVSRRRVLISFGRQHVLHFVFQVRDCGYQFLKIPRKQYLKSV